MLWILQAVFFAAQGPSDNFLIRNVRVFDGERVLEHRSVVVRNDKIAEVGELSVEPEGVSVVDGNGDTLLPGLMECHVHVADDARGALRQALSLGITTVLDMFSSGERLERIKELEAEDSPDVADVRTAATGAAAPGGHPTQMGGPPIPTLASPDQAQAFVDARIAEGADYIKIIYDDLGRFGNPLPMLSKQTLEALVTAAHRRGKTAVVHIGTEEQARDAIAAGADGLAHLFTGETVSADFARFAASYRVFVIPTLSTLYTSCGESDGPSLLADPHLRPFIRPEWQRPLQASWPFKPQSCTGANDAMRQLARAGAPILAGTDAPIPGTTYGASVHGELALLVRNGLTPVQALAAATSIPARVFHLEDRGRVRVGGRADLLLVEGDPTRDILATRNIVTVWKRGAAFPRQDLRT